MVILGWFIIPPLLALSPGEGRQRLVPMENATKECFGASSLPIVVPRTSGVHMQIWYSTALAEVASEPLVRSRDLSRLRRPRRQGSIRAFPGCKEHSLVVRARIDSDHL